MGLRRESERAFANTSYHRTGKGLCGEGSCYTPCRTNTTNKPMNITVKINGQVAVMKPDTAQQLIIEALKARAIRTNGFTAYCEADLQRKFMMVKDEVRLIAEEVHGE